MELSNKLTDLTEQQQQQQQHTGTGPTSTSVVNLRYIIISVHVVCVCVCTVLLHSIVQRKFGGHFNLADCQIVHDQNPLTRSILALMYQSKMCTDI